jgi:glycosyltransferase involved in cell wall biosynthesis
MTADQGQRISVLVATKNEAQNLGHCLDALQGWADEIIVVDSQSTDGSIELAQSYGAKVLQFHYEGGWPKKRQWTLDTHQWQNDWILLLDADEILGADVKDEIDRALSNPKFNGYWLRFQIVFLGRMLRYGDTELWKLSLFRIGKGRYEKRLENQTTDMADIEIHEHVCVAGAVNRIQSPIRHENINSLDRYIEKHNAYSNWEAKVFLEGTSEIKPSLLGSQSQRRRWLKQRLLMMPGFSVLVFLFTYVWKLGVLDGQSGLIYALFRSVQMFHIKAKICEARLSSEKDNDEIEHRLTQGACDTSNLAA